MVLDQVLSWPSRRLRQVDSGVGQITSSSYVIRAANDCYCESHGRRIAKIGQDVVVGMGIITPSPGLMWSPVCELYAESRAAGGW